MPPRAGFAQNTKGPGFPGPFCLDRQAGAAQAACLRARRRRPISVAAPAPNSSSIGGAGTSVPPVELVDDEVLVEPPVEVELLVELDVDELVELDVDELVELLVDDEVLVELLDVTFPDEVLVELLEVTLPELVETLPDEVLTFPDEVDTFPDEVLTLPELVEVEVEMLPDEVLVDPPEVLVEPPEVLDELDPPEVLVDPVLVELITTDPPPLPPPPKNPPKKPPPMPPPQPPPITTGALLPPAGCGGIGGSIGIAAKAICGAGSHVVVVRVITRRTRFTLRGATATRLTRGAGALATLACLTYCGREVFCPSATCTAPPPISAPPAAKAASLAMAVRTDIIFSHYILGREQRRNRMGQPRRANAQIAETQRVPATTIALTESKRGKIAISGPDQDRPPKLSRNGTEPGRNPHRLRPARAAVACPGVARISPRRRTACPSCRLAG